MPTTQEQHQMATAPPSATNATNAEDYESAHVHAVYEAIAPHFSSTRHSPWPRVAAYLQAQPPGAIGLDVGCGNGKYLDVNPMLHMLGSDRSNELVRLARARGSSRHQTTDAKSHDDNAARGAGGDHRGGGGGCVVNAAGTEVAVADGLALPYRLCAFDFVICIAVVHHLSTRERRIDAIGELLSRLRPSPAAAAAARTSPDDANRSSSTNTGSSSNVVSNATALVFVWALEQASSRRGWDRGSEQDTLVPWVMRTKGQPNETFQRYYHLYKEGELEEDIVSAGGVVEESGYERDNWWAIFSRPHAFREEETQRTST